MTSWDFTKDASMTHAASDAKLKEMELARDRSAENAEQKLRPTFLVRIGSRGTPVISYLARLGEVANVAVEVLPDNGGYAVTVEANGAIKAFQDKTLSALLAKMDYLPLSVDLSPYVQFTKPVSQVVVSEYQSSVVAVRAATPPAVAGSHSGSGVGTSRESHSGSSIGANRESHSGSSAERAPQIAAQIVPTTTATPARMWAVQERDIKLGTRLGEGQFGEVYKATFKGSTVAVKKLKALDGSRSPAQAAQAAKDIVAELEIMQTLLYHENVVAFRGAVVDAAGVPVAIVTEFCTSGSLEAAIKSDEWLKWKTTKVRIVLGVAKGVEHLHTYKIVHRDLAARNVLLANPKDPVPKVADFGMSRAVDDVEATQLTEKQLGPVRWMAPEQFHRRAYSAYSDVYSFGCVVYEVFMREYPWASIDVVKVAMEVFDGKRPQFSDESKLPSKLLALVQRCWNHEAKNRPTMEEVREQLESIKTHVSRSKSHKKE